MDMSMLQELLRQHQAEVEAVEADIAESEEIYAQLRERHDANVHYFQEVCAESIRASQDLFEALSAREESRLDRLRNRLAELKSDRAGPPALEVIDTRPQGNGQIAAVLGGQSTPGVRKPG